jgi:hypothetical protein
MAKMIYKTAFDVWSRRGLLDVFDSHAEQFRWSKESSTLQEAKQRINDPRYYWGDDYAWGKLLTNGPFADLIKEGRGIYPLIVSYSSREGKYSANKVFALPPNVNFDDFKYTAIFLLSGQHYTLLASERSTNSGDLIVVHRLEELPPSLREVVEYRRRLYESEFHITRQ